MPQVWVCGDDLWPTSCKPGLPLLYKLRIRGQASSMKINVEAHELGLYGNDIEMEIIEVGLDLHDFWRRNLTWADEGYGWTVAIFDDQGNLIHWADQFTLSITE